MLPSDASPPNYWMYETGGELGEAVAAYLNHAVMTHRHIALMRAYLRQYIVSPVWQGGADLEALRREVNMIESVEDISRWLHRALEWGIDPL